MPPAPNERLAGLVEVLGEADARELVRLFLGSYPGLARELASGDRARSHRAAHSLKSTSQQMGLDTLARRMLELELRLARPDGTLTQADLDQAAAEFAREESPLREFAGPG